MVSSCSTFHPRVSCSTCVLKYLQSPVVCHCVGLPREHYEQQEDVNVPVGPLSVITVRCAPVRSRVVVLGRRLEHSTARPGAVRQVLRSVRCQPNVSSTSASIVISSCILRCWSLSAVVAQPRCIAAGCSPRRKQKAGRESTSRWMSGEHRE